VANDDTRLSNLLLDSGANVNAVNSLQQVCIWYRVTSPSVVLVQTACHVAASLGLVDQLRLLLDRKAVVDAADSCGHTPLFYAASEVRYDSHGVVSCAT